VLTAGRRLSPRGGRVWSVMRYGGDIIEEVVHFKGEYHVRQFMFYVRRACCYSRCIR
jgi:hypothetical protein